MGLCGRVMNLMMHTPTTYLLLYQLLPVDGRLGLLALGEKKRSGKPLVQGRCLRFRRVRLGGGAFAMGGDDWSGKRVGTLGELRGRFGV